ncbi:hypothetical protein P5V15_001054 [Pogonomyrmex californicus]
MEEVISSLAFQTKALHVTEKKEVKNLNQKKKESLKDLKKRTKCNHCNQKGHWTQECWKRIAAIKFEKKKDEKSESRKSSASTYMCKMLESCTDSVKDEDVWIADSGTSMHMTSRREFFKMIEPVKEMRTIKIADNKMLPIADVGMVETEVSVNGNLFD